MPLQNYSTNECDLEAICAFCDKEIAAGHWSHPITTLLPGMKVSPMFVVWQHGKPCVVTNHTASGINQGIPPSEGYVCYDNMVNFGQELCFACMTNPHDDLIL